MAATGEVEPSVVSAIFERHGFREAWSHHEATGIANRIYATSRVVLRIPTDHPQAWPDAHTESIAAPAAFAAGIRTPALLAFDDTHELLDRSYSLWERVQGQTLGRYAPDARRALAAWAEIGRELACLHLSVSECPDPNGWLETIDNGDPHLDLAKAARSGKLEPSVVRRLENWIGKLEPLLASPPPVRFLHGDLHDMNVMCNDAGAFVALIDWGDAGWADPAAEFTDLPLVALTTTVAAHEEVAPGLLGTNPVARVLWHRIARGLNRLVTGRGADHLDELLGYGESAAPDWRQFWG